MSRICYITAKRPKTGNTVSHANKKIKRRFDINLHSKRFWSELQNKFIRLRISAKGLRIIDKLGLDNVLNDIVKYRKDIVK